MTDSMRAFGVRQSGDTDRLIEDRVSVPVLGEREVLVQVAAVGVNPVDVYFRSTPWEEVAEGFPKSLPTDTDGLYILGADVCGTVVSTGPAVTRLRVGDEVYASGPAMAARGAHSEFVAMDERIVARKPATLSHGAAAAYPMVGITAWESLFDIMRVRPDGEDAGRSLLVIGGSGGTGSMAIQLGKAVAGLRVVATAGSTEAQQWCRVLGADTVVDHRSALDEQLRTAGHEAFDFILCCTATTPYLELLGDWVAPYGHVCTLVADLADVPFDRFRMKSASFGIEFMGLRPMGPQIERHGEILDKIARLIDDGVLADIALHQLSPITIESMREAHRRVEQGSLGKVTVADFA